MSKKWVALLLSVLCALQLASCGSIMGGSDALTEKESTDGNESNQSNESERPDETEKETTESLDNNESDQPNETERQEETNGNHADDETGGVNGGDVSDKNEDEELMAEVYKKYPDLKFIDSFDNGIAGFFTHETGGGYMDVQGNILYERLLLIGPWTYPYKQMTSQYNEKFIGDTMGNILFKVGENQVVDLGTISNGYFYVQTLIEEAIKGNVYRVEYYSAVTGKVVATFDDVYSLGHQKNVADNGNFDIELYVGGDVQNAIFNIAEFDSSFVPVTESEDWPVDLENIPEFAGAYSVYTAACVGDGYAAVIIQSRDGKFFYAVVNEAGEIVMQPQTRICFYHEDYEAGNDWMVEWGRFSKGLCPAFDSETRMWGYIDPQGNWMIQPQYGSASSFNTSGYATVNRTTVIDRTGNAVLAGPGWGKENPTSVTGTYWLCYNTDPHGYKDRFSMTFYENGEIICTKQSSITGGRIYVRGTYFINGYSIDIDGVSWEYNPILDYYQKSFGFLLDGDKLYLNGSVWELETKESDQ